MRTAWEHLGYEDDGDSEPALASGLSADHQRTLDFFSRLRGRESDVYDTQLPLQSILSQQLDMQNQVSCH
jgi:hypothetical protein